MKTYLDCIPCFMRQALDAARNYTTDEAFHAQVMSEVTGLINSIDLNKFYDSPVLTGSKIHKCVKELAGNNDPYSDIKKQQNDSAISVSEHVRRVISESSNRISTAIRFAIAGNHIDLGAFSKVSENEILDEILKAEKVEISGELLKTADEISKASDVLYLLDNAGEIVFDRLLIEAIGPEKVTAVVRGGPIINDATMKDAQYCGLTDICSVIENGSEAPGTVLDMCSPHFRDLFEKSTYIIAKGQGNFESLNDEHFNGVFLFKVKCDIAAQISGLKKGQYAVLPQRKETDS
ncbi:MAG: DUF89 family protein [Deltaproteobacteria bacterium]|nr:DUF89 family protein [Deltaproteobacteria bacterium]